MGVSAWRADRWFLVSLVGVSVLLSRLLTCTEGEMEVCGRLHAT